MKKKLISRKDFALLAGVTSAAITNACEAKLAPACVGKRIDASHAAAVEYVARRQAATGSSGVDPLYASALDYCLAEKRFVIVHVARRFGIGVDRARKLIRAMRDAGVVPPPLPPSAPQPEAPAEPKTPHVRGGAARNETKKRNAPEEIPEIPDNIMPFVDMTLRDLIKKFGTGPQFVDYLSALQKIESINEKRLKAAEKEGLLVNRDMVQKDVIDPFNATHMRLMKDGAKTITAGVIAKHAGGFGQVEIELYVSDILGSFIRPVKAKIARLLRGI